MSEPTKNYSNIVSSLQSHSTDTGTSEVQIANLTQRIEMLTQHFKTHAKDFAGRRGLLNLVSKRRSLLAYLKKSSQSRYAAVLAKLDLRH